MTLLWLQVCHFTRIYFTDKKLYSYERQFNGQYNHGIEMYIYAKEFEWHMFEMRKYGSLSCPYWPTQICASPGFPNFPVNRKDIGLKFILQPHNHIAQLPTNFCWKQINHNRIIAEYAITENNQYIKVSCIWAVILYTFIFSNIYKTLVR